MYPSRRSLYHVPWPYQFCHTLLRTPAIGSLFLIFYIFGCLPAEIPDILFWVISTIVTIVSFFTAALTVFGTPIAFIVSLFFIGNYNSTMGQIYIVVSILAFLVYVCYIIPACRLASGRYLLVPLVNRIIVNPDWVGQRIMNISHPDHSDDSKGALSIVIILFVLFALLVSFILASSSGTSYTPPALSRATASPQPTNTGSYYERYYPNTWNYICKYTFSPYEYVKIYDRIWGDLQRYHGDGIPFATLTAYEQSLVNYPDHGQYIYVSSGSHTYHNTRDCYTLLRSTSVLRYSYISHIRYSPCSKCVGE